MWIQHVKKKNYLSHHLFDARKGSFPSTRARRAAAGAVRRTRDGAPGSAAASPSATGFAARRREKKPVERGGIFCHEMWI